MRSAVLYAYQSSMWGCLCSKAGKMRPKEARGEYIKCVHNLSNNLKNLEMLEKEQRRLKQELYWKNLLAEDMDEEMFKPRTDYALWNQWLQEQSQKLWRQRAFCFTGDSRVGKTEFVKASLDGGVFVCTCSTTDEPDLRDFEGPPFVNNILFDEASPRLVSEHRELFQAPRHEVSLGHSTTNCYAYKVRVWRVRMVICTNKWYKQLEELPKEDQEWLNKNVYVVEVTDSMFTQESVKKPKTEASQPSTSA